MFVGERTCPDSWILPQALLSFGEEAEEEEAQVDTFQVKPRSIHDAVTDDPRLVAVRSQNT